MKIGILFLLSFAKSQSSLEQKVENISKKCSTFMEKAYHCYPPKGKIGKYNYRIKKVKVLNVQQPKESKNSDFA